MAVPQIVAAIVAVVGFLTIEELKFRGREYILEKIGEAGDKVGKVAAQAALDALGIPLDLDGEVSEATITNAINVGVLGGQIELTNVFDRDALKADMKRIALEQAAVSFGHDKGAGIEAIRDGLVSELVAEIKVEIEAGAGDYVSASIDSALALRALARDKVEDWNTPKDLSEKGEKNRERQTRYRASHERVWV